MQGSSHSSVASCRISAVKSSCVLDCLLQDWKFSLSDFCALEYDGPRGRAGQGSQVLTSLFGHDQLVLRFPINHGFPLAHLQRKRSRSYRNCRFIEQLVSLTLVYLHTGAVFVVFREEGSFFCSKLVRCWGGRWTPKEDSSVSEVKEWLSSSCSVMEVTSEELVSKLSSASCNTTLRSN